MTDESLRELREVVENGSKDELRERFGPLMSATRSHRALDGRVTMLLDAGSMGRSSGTG